MVTTADGIIAKHSGHNVDWSSPEDKKMFREETKNHGIVIVGSSTFKTMGKHMPGRLNLVLTENPEQYADKVIPGELEFIEATPAEIVAEVKKRGFESAALIGGARVNASFFKAGLVDELMLTIEPKIFGQGLKITEGEDLDIDMELLETKKLNDQTIWMHYKIKK